MSLDDSELYDALIERFDQPMKKTDSPAADLDSMVVRFNKDSGTEYNREQADGYHILRLI